MVLDRVNLTHVSTRRGVSSFAVYDDHDEDDEDDEDAVVAAAAPAALGSTTPLPGGAAGAAAAAMPPGTVLGRHAPSPSLSPIANDATTHLQPAQQPPANVNLGDDGSGDELEW